MLQWAGQAQTAVKAVGTSSISSVVKHTVRVVQAPPHCVFAAFSVNVVDGVIDIEFAGRGDDLVALDHLDQFAGTIIHHDDGGLLFLTAPYREPDLSAVLVELGLDDALRAGTKISPFSGRPSMLIPTWYRLF